ncbi:toll-like receptor 2 type-2 [Anneissia japonica]|uniref:toll-like receptor 2 type-2 n=1 Tax=Anneissia japonica TaxID=1529436 RepID=UPI0014257AF7|nr:toll-like receptor 2 type-2 [Anneissia japonica]
MRKWRPVDVPADDEWTVNYQIVVPPLYRPEILSMAHETSLSGHLGVREAVVDNIANAVKYSRKVLLVVSKNFIKSEWCYFELEMARMRMFDNHEDILVVVVLEKVSAKDMPILLHKILTTTTYIEWEEHPERQALFWVKLEAALLSPNCPRYRLLDNPQE